MSEDLKAQAEKEVGRADDIVSAVDMVDDRAAGLMEVLESYRADARGFLEKKKYLQALEAAFICWAYVDAGLHLGVFRVPDKMKDVFTV